jgi:hypothetical protein
MMGCLACKITRICLAPFYALRVKVMVSLWLVALATRCRVLVEGMLPAFSIRAMLACAVLSFAASSVWERPAAVRAARIAAPS